MYAQPAQSARLGVEPATFESQVQRPNHYTSRPHMLKHNRFLYFHLIIFARGNALSFDSFFYSFLEEGMAI